MSYDSVAFPVWPSMLSYVSSSFSLGVQRKTRTEASAGAEMRPFWQFLASGELFIRKCDLWYEAWFEVFFFRNVQQKLLRNLQRKFVNNPDDAINVILFFFTVFLSAYVFKCLLMDTPPNVSIVSKLRSLQKPKQIEITRTLCWEQISCFNG